ncbi:MAG TPA: hypothetical protein VHO06_07930, partial [Polyangia bacterium]|nr:hypothetical protein [Polyangia bacterium]
LGAGREVGTAWAALAELAGDERGPVRVGTVDALAALAARPRGASALVEHALGWLDLDDREVRFGAAGVVLEVLARRQVLAALSRPDALFDYLTRAMAAVVDAPRSAERSDGRRRLLFALPPALGAAVTAFAAGDRGPAWLEAECRAARHPDLRAALSTTVVAIGDKASGLGAMLADRLRTALEGSAKPPRDPTRRRPGAGRGKSSRPVR